MSYHISKDGIARECTARYTCPLGGESEHYSMKSEAQVVADSRSESEFGLVSTVGPINEVLNRARIDIINDLNDELELNNGKFNIEEFNFNESGELIGLSTSCIVDPRYTTDADKMIKHESDGHRYVDRDSEIYKKLVKDNSFSIKQYGRIPSTRGYTIKGEDVGLYVEDDLHGIVVRDIEFDEAIANLRDAKQAIFRIVLEDMKMD